MDYVLLRSEDGTELLQESCRGHVTRYTDLDGNTIEFAGAATVVGTLEPVWGLPDTPLVTEAPVQDSKITRLAFRNRFTQTEKVAIEIAALDVPSATMQQRTLAAALRANQADVLASTFIDLSRPDTRAGVQQLETFGLLAAGRAAVILDSPISDNERPL